VTAAVHRPATSILIGDNRTAQIHFHCPSCGVTRQLTICDVEVSPPLRFTAAIRSLHERDLWPPAEVATADQADDDEDDYLQALEDFHEAFG
jgi:hypothetical protein